MILFTAADKIYAEKVLKIIDEKNEFFILKFFRKNCVLINNMVLLKNLNFLYNLNFENLLIIDNNPEHFFCHLKNIMPIIPFYGEEHDEELLKVGMFLDDIEEVRDFRKVLEKFFFMERLVGLEQFEHCAELFL